MAKKFACDTSTIVRTEPGLLQGFLLDGIYTFHGIKYADAERFRPPRPVAPWEGVKTALAYGYVAPLLTRDEPTNELLIPHRYWPMDENCQYLNIWTPVLDPRANMPVLVWLHGGGYSAGSSIEQVAYEGDNMSRYGNCVTVTLNHRLNILGYLDLSPFGAKYKYSGNAGHADIVAALCWIRKNIANFGGDPDNVTVFGQSGGGGKVSCLLQTPAADGLFHRGIIQSGVSAPLLPDADHGERGDGTAIVNALLRALGFPENDPEPLETVPYARLAAAYTQVAPAIAKDGGYVGCSPLADDYYLGNPMIRGFTDHAKTVPVLIGTVMCEFMAFSHEAPSGDGEETVMAKLRAIFGSDTRIAVDLYRRAFPGKKLAYLPMLDMFFRRSTREYAMKKAAVSSAPVYSYMFTYEFPYGNGKPAWHCSEIPFVFHNAERVAVCGDPGVTETLQDNIFSAWMRFARSGDPNHPGIPHWTPTTAREEHCMLMDREFSLRTNFDHALMELLAKKMSMDSPFDDIKVEH